MIWFRGETDITLVFETSVEGSNPSGIASACAAAKDCNSRDLHVLAFGQAAGFLNQLVQVRSLSSTLNDNITDTVRW